MSFDNPLERLETINVINTIARPERLPDDVIALIRVITLKALNSYVEVGQTTHFVDQLLKQSRTEPLITLHSLFGGTRQAINNIVREEVITHMTSLAKERDKEL